MTQLGGSSKWLHTPEGEHLTDNPEGRNKTDKQFARALKSHLGKHESAEVVEQHRAEWTRVWNSPCQVEGVAFELLHDENRLHKNAEDLIGTEDFDEFITRMAFHRAAVGAWKEEQDEAFRTRMEKVREDVRHRQLVALAEASEAAEWFLPVRNITGIRILIKDALPAGWVDIFAPHGGREKWSLFATSPDGDKIHKNFDTAEEALADAIVCMNSAYS